MPAAKIDAWSERRGGAGLFARRLPLLQPVAFS
jgi:hypothetical protein